MKTPTNVTFELTSRCNFNCKMCYVHDSDCNRNRPCELTTGQWIEVAERAKEAGALFVLLTGGEPMIREDFNGIYEALAGMGFVLSVNTNLSLLSEQTLSVLEKHPPNRVNVSLYGTGNDVYAELCGVPAFETVAANIGKLKERGIPVRANSSITVSNLADAENILRYCEANELNLKSTAYMFPAARLSCTRERLSPEAVAAYRAAADHFQLSPEDFADRSRRIQEGVSSLERECPEVEGEECGIRCRAGSSSAWIDWRGNMSYCGMIPAPEDNNVLRRGYDECWRQTVKAAQAVRMPAKCGVCAYRHFCNVCAASQFCETGGFDAPPPYICEISAHTPQAYQALVKVQAKPAENGGA